MELSLAISSGILTAFSPCAVPFLPNLVAFYLRDENGGVGGGKGSAAFALGLLILLLPLVLLALAASTLLVDYTALFVLASGVVTLLLAFGAWKGIPLLPRWSMRVSPQASGYRPLFVMGSAYVAAAVGCAPALTLGVTATAVAAGSLADSTLILLAFVISVVAPTLVLSILAAEYRETYADKLRRLMAPLKKASVGLMFGMGVYLIVFYVLYVYAGLPV